MIRAREDRWFDRFRRTGDARLLAQVFDRTAGELGRVATYLCRDRDDAEDAVQGTFLVAIEARHEWDATRPLLPWLLGVLVNRVREQRRRRRQPDAARVRTPADAPDPADVAADGEVGEVVRRALQRLPEPYRETLERHLVHGQSAAEIAAASGTPAGTVRMRLLRGLDQLRQRLPAGVAGGVAAPALAPESLAAIRRAVLASTPGGTEVAAVGAGAGHFLLQTMGVIVMTKSLQTALAAGLALALALLLWIAPNAQAPVPAPTTPAAAPVAAALPTDAPTAAALAADRAAAPAAADAPRPLPADATWVEVRVVDGRSGAPIAGIDVHWVDETATQRLADTLDEVAVAELGWLPIEALADRVGWRTRSDDQGRARVTLRRETQVATAHAGRYAVLTLRHDEVAPPAGRLLRLEPDRTLAVRVIDAAGQPVAGAPVAVTSRQRDGAVVGSYSWTPRARTGADGVATVPHLQLVAADFAQATQPDAALRAECAHFVKLGLPGCDDVRAAIDLDAAAQRVDLRLPAHGSLRVRGELDGKPLANLRIVHLDAEGDPTALDFGNFVPATRRTTQTAAVGDDGFAHFARVPLGKRWTVRSTAAGGVAATADGPRLPGQEVTITLTPEAASQCLLRGRALAADGQPLRRATLRIQTVGAMPPAMRAKALRRVEVGTDDEGGFVAGLQPVADGTPVDLVVEASPTDGPPHVRKLTGWTLAAGPLHLGDLTLPAVPLLVRGRLVRDGAPIPTGCMLWVRGQGPAPAGGRAPTLVPDAIVRFDGAGGFAIYGETDLVDLCLEARDRSAGGAPAKVRFAKGADDVVVDIPVRHALAARALLPDGAAADDVIFELRADGAPATAPARSNLRGRNTRDTANGDVRVNWDSLAAGTYTLLVHTSSRSEPALSIPAVTVPPPADGDMRLRAIDLRSALRTVTIRLFDGAGRPMPATSGALLCGPLAHHEAIATVSFRTTQNTCVVTLGAGPYAGTLCVDGYRPQAIGGDADALDVRLVPWPEATVRIANVPPLPDAVGVVVRVHRVGYSPPVALSGPALLRQMSAGAPVQPASERLWPGCDWQLLTPDGVRHPVGDGPHTVEVALVSTRTDDLMTLDGRLRLRSAAPMATVAYMAPTSFTWTGAPVEVTAPAPAWHSALASLRQQMAAASDSGK